MTTTSPGRVAAGRRVRTASSMFFSEAWGPTSVQASSRPHVRFITSAIAKASFSPTFRSRIPGSRKSLIPMNTPTLRGPPATVCGTVVGGFVAGGAVAGGAVLGGTVVGGTVAGVPVVGGAVLPPSGDTVVVVTSCSAHSAGRFFISSTYTPLTPSGVTMRTT